MSFVTRSSHGWPKTTTEQRFAGSLSEGPSAETNDERWNSIEQFLTLRILTHDAERLIRSVSTELLAHYDSRGDIRLRQSAGALSLLEEDVRRIPGKLHSLTAWQRTSLEETLNGIMRDLKRIERCELKVQEHSSTIRDIRTDINMDTFTNESSDSSRTSKSDISKAEAVNLAAKRTRLIIPMTQPSPFFMHYTISEDRTGTEESIKSSLLAALGDRERSKQRRSETHIFHLPP